MNGYDLSRNFWNWAFDNPEKISTNHAAIFFFAVEHCNRLGGKEKFGFPSQMTMDAIGIKKHQTYIRYFNELVDYGFFKLIQKSKNQYSANIISLIYAVPKKGKALDKAIIKHRAKQTETTGQSKDSIVKPINKQTIKPIYSDEIKDFTHSILKHFPVKPKKIEDWYKISDELIRLDKYNYDSIRLIVETFTADGNFWKANFQSYSKLRKLNKDKIKYIDYFKNYLIAEKNGENKGSDRKNQGATNEEIQTIFNKHFNPKGE